MEEVFGRHGTTPTPVKGVYGAAYAEDNRYQQVLDGVEAVSRRLGASPACWSPRWGRTAMIAAPM
jgi:methylmalonyl-CoA mutase